MTTEINAENIGSVKKTLELLPDGDLKKSLLDMIEKYEKRQQAIAERSKIVGAIMTQVRTALKEVRPKDLILELEWNASGELTIKDKVTGSGGNREPIGTYEAEVNGKKYKGHGFRELAFAIDPSLKNKKYFNARAWLDTKKVQYKEVAS